MSNSMRDDVEQTLRAIAARFSGDLAVAARDLGSGEEIAVNADATFPTASVIKLPLLVELMRQAHEGKLSLDARVPLNAVDKQGGSGILKVLDEGLQLTLRDVATLMVVVSDNTATNLAIDAVGGVGAVDAAMDELGLSTIRLHNRIDFELIGTEVRRLGESSARDMCALIHGIAERTVFGAEVSEAVEAVLAQQQYLDQASRYVEVSPYAAELGLDPSIRVANKTGFFTGTRADAGVFRFRGGGGFTYAMFHHGSKDESFLPEAEGQVVHGLVGKVLVEHWWPSAVGPAPTVGTAYNA
jgi:beta-lactamase class A